FSIASNSEIWISESHSSTSAAVSCGVSSTLSMKRSSKIGCKRVMTSVCVIGSFNKPDLGRLHLVRFRFQFEFQSLGGLHRQGCKAQIRVMIPHHPVFRGRQVDSADARRAMHLRQPHDLVQDLV